MPEESTTAAVESTSPAAPSTPASAQDTFEVPKESKAYEQWRYGTSPKADSTPAKPPSEPKPKKSNGEGEQDAPDDAAEPEPAREERQPSKAERRLNELLADLKRYGLTPAELKAARREAKAAQEDQQPKAPPEKRAETAPANGSDAPKKPRQDDFKTWEEYENARDKYFEDLADYKARNAVQQDRQSQREEAAKAEMLNRLEEAKKRYGAESADTIVGAARAIFTDQAIPGVIREVLNGSSALVDVLYALGKDESDLSDFVEQCKTDPGAALRKAVIVEKLVLEELGKNGSATPRDGDGKFVAQGKKQSSAPPPPRQVSGTSGPPKDEAERAVEQGNFRAYFETQNRRDLARHRGQ